MGKNQDPGSGINIPDPQHWYRTGTLYFSISIRHLIKIQYIDTVYYYRYRYQVFWYRTRRICKVLARLPTRITLIQIQILLLIKERGTGTVPSTVPATTGLKSL